MEDKIPAPEEIEQSKRKEGIVAAARDALHREGSCEIDPDAEISEGDDNGCYVRSWTWFSFVGTPWDKEKKDDAV